LSWFGIEREEIRMEHLGRERERKRERERERNKER
jgi:hypothetical protein